MKNKFKLFCFGFGQVAESFINKLIDEKKDFDFVIPMDGDGEDRPVEIKMLVEKKY